MKSVQQIVEEQVHRWQILSKEEKEQPAELPVVTISREPGSGGRIVATHLGEKMAFDVFHQEVLHQMAESTKVGARLIETIDEKGLNLIEEAISALVHEHHLWPDEYLKHLMKIVGVIAEHGRSVVVGRGANFILPRDRCFRVRVIASMATRVERMCKEFSLSKEEAKRRLILTESDRRAFIRKYFNAEIADPLNYDLVINTDHMSISAAVDTIRCALGS